MKKIEDFPVLKKILDGEKQLSDRSKKEFSEFFIATNEPEIDSVTCILRLHLLVERKLNEMLQKLLKNSKKILAPKSGFSYSHKLELISSFGLVETGLISSLKALNTARNRCAHEFGYEISKRDLDSIWLPLRRKKLIKTMKVLSRKTGGGYLNSIALILWSLLSAYANALE